MDEHNVLSIFIYGFAENDSSCHDRELKNNRDFHIEVVLY